MTAKPNDENTGKKRGYVALKPIFIELADQLLSQGEPMSSQDIGALFEKKHPDLLTDTDKYCSITKKSYYTCLKHAIEALQEMMAAEGASLIVSGNRRNRTYAYPDGRRPKQELAKKAAAAKKVNLQRLFSKVITNGVAVRLTYNAGFQRRIELVLHPYRLKLYNYRWFVVGTAVVDGNDYEDSIYALDRIVDISEQRDVKYIRPRKDYDHFFDDIIGVTHVKNRPRQQIEIATLDKYTHYRILTKPLHTSQKEIAPYTDSEGEGRITISVVPNFELRSLLLSFGATIRVVSPADIADELKAQIQEMAKIYAI